MKSSPGLAGCFPSTFGSNANKLSGAGSVPAPSVPVSDGARAQRGLGSAAACPAGTEPLCAAAARGLLTGSSRGAPPAPL